MASHNRHLRGDQNIVMGKVHGNVVIEAGDLVAHNGTAGAIDNGAGQYYSADNYVFPLDEFNNGASKTDRIKAAYDGFMGVAMEASEDGVTEEIAIATAGVVRYPLYRTKGVTVGQKVSMTSCIAANGASPQAVWQGSSAPGTTGYLGVIVKTEAGASFVDFALRTIYNGLAS